jgi:hypothetical protein
MRYLIREERGLSDLKQLLCKRVDLFPTNKAAIQPLITMVWDTDVKNEPIISHTYVHEYLVSGDGI